MQAALEDELGKVREAQAAQAQLSAATGELVAAGAGHDRIGALLSVYALKLPPPIFYPHLLAAGDELLAAGEARAAAALCYDRYLDAAAAGERPAPPPRPAPAPTAAAQRAAEERWEEAAAATALLPAGPAGLPPRLALTLYARAMYGSALASLHRARLADPNAKFPRTLQQLLRVLRRLQAGMQAVLQAPAAWASSLYWLVFNGSVHVLAVAEPLIALGFGSDVAQFLAVRRRVGVGVGGLGFFLGWGAGGGGGGVYWK